MPGSDRRPDILVLFCDQLRRDLLGCYGNQLVRTPHIDALAADGLVFDRACTPTAICSPARASLLTGLYPHAHHLFNNSTPKYSYCEHLRPDITMLQDWAADCTDRETAYFGKWHIGPADDLFRSRFHHTHPRPHQGGPGFLAGSHWHPGGLGPLVREPAPGCGTVSTPMESFPDVYAADRTREFLARRDPRRPYLAFCSFPGPHVPWVVPEEFGIRYDPREVPLWPTRHDTMAGKPLNQRKLRLLGEVHPRRRPAGDQEWRARLACCFSYIELIDVQVGRIVADLKRTGRYGDTAIFFTADHGDMAGAHGFASKGAYMYDDIYRIPLIYKPAGPAGHRRSTAPVHLMDVSATCLELMAGRPVEELNGRPLHGASLAALAGGDAAWTRPVNYAEFHGDWYGHYSSRMVSDGRWKLVWNLSDLGELYHLEADPGEMNNLFYDPAGRRERDRLFEIMQAEARRLEDAHLRLLQPEVEDRLAAGLFPAGLP